MRIALIIALISAASAVSAEQTPTERTLGKIISAYVLEQTCPTMRVDVVAVGAKLRELGLSPSDIAPGGRYHQMMVDQAIRMRATDEMSLDAGKSVADLRAFNCRNASEFYGPNGWVLKGVMIPR